MSADLTDLTDSECGSESQPTPKSNSKTHRFNLDCRSPRGGSGKYLPDAANRSHASPRHADGCGYYGRHEMRSAPHRPRLPSTMSAFSSFRSITSSVTFPSPKGWQHNSPLPNHVSDQWLMQGAGHPAAPHPRLRLRSFPSCGKGDPEHGLEAAAWGDPLSMDDHRGATNGPFYQQAPSLREVAMHQLLPCVVTLALMAMAAAGLFVPNGQPFVPWYPVLYVLLVLVLVVGQWVYISVKDRELVIAMGAELSRLTAGGVPEYSPRLSSDARLRYIQALLHRAGVQDVLARYEAQQQRADVLHFLRADLEEWQQSDQGYVVADTSGTILWSNEALCRFFQCTPEELHDENVRVLMPAPYAKQHDQFLRQHLETGVRKVLGRERLVPVVKRDASQAMAWLSLEDRTDGVETRAFVARMRFVADDPVLAPFREQVARSVPLSECVQALDESLQPLVVMSPEGTLEYINTAATRLLGWTLAELQEAGGNMRLLMAEPFAGRHDGFLRRYLEQAHATEQRGGHGPTSRAVNNGRDVVAKHKHGARLRVFLTVERLDRASGKAKDCLFVGAMLRVVDGAACPSVGAAESSCGGSPATPPDCAAAAGSSFPPTPRAAPAANALAVMRWAPLQPLAPRKCTMVVVDVHGLYCEPRDEAAAVVTRDYEAFLAQLHTGCQRTNGCLQWLLGDRAIVTFNCAVPNTSHRSSAAQLLGRLTADWKSAVRTPGLRLYAAAATRRGYYGLWGTQAVLVGDAVDVCSAMLRAAAEAKVALGVIDPALHDELQYTYHCRTVNVLTLHPQTAHAAVLPVYELQAAKECATEEWMYQIGGAMQNDPLIPWQKVWDHLRHDPTPHSGAACQYPAALDWLAQHLEAHPRDETGLWLQQVIRLLWQHGADVPRPVQVVGKLPFLLHFSCTEPAVSTPHSSGRHAYGRRSGAAMQVAVRSLRSSVASNRSCPDAEGHTLSPRHVAVACAARLGDAQRKAWLSEPLKALVDAVSDAVVVVDAHGAVRYCNGPTEDVFGWPPEEAVGQRIGALFAPELWARCVQAKGRVRDVEGVHRTGTPVCVDVTVVTCAAGAEDEVRFVGVTRARHGSPDSAAPDPAPHPEAPPAGLIAIPARSVAERFEPVSVVSAALVGFTATGLTATPEEACGMLNDLLRAFDCICDGHGLTRLRASVDRYVAAAGLARESSDGAERAVECGLALVRKVRELAGQEGRLLELRVGVGTGSVIVGALGDARARREVWGVAMDSAFQAEGAGPADHVSVSEGTFRALPQRWQCSFRDSGREAERTYVFGGRRSLAPL